MNLELKVQVSDKLYLRDPEASELGKKIVRTATLMIDELGFEDFTFKKLAARIPTTEAGVYRYFENKHKLLTYLTTWYWNWLEYLVIFNTHHLTAPREKLEKVVAIMAGPEREGVLPGGLDTHALYRIAVNEGNKAYLTREVNAYNQNRLFKPYKDLCARIAGIIQEVAQWYAFPHSLASTLIETAHFQRFFMDHLPSLTDFGQPQDEQKLYLFLRTLVFSGLEHPTD